MEGPATAGHWMSGTKGAEFPNGWCDVSSLLVTRYLQQVLGLEAVSVRADSPYEFHQSHVWTRVGRTNVDITADQFAPGSMHAGAPPCIVAEDSPWHDNWGPAGEAKLDDELSPETLEVWERLVTAMEEAGFGRPPTPTGGNAPAVT